MNSLNNLKLKQERSVFKLGSCPNSVIGLWTRFDWRENLFAPSIHIIQALGPGGATASGAGDSPNAAFQRCLSETAEIHALECLATQAEKPSSLFAFEPTRDGIAAAPSKALADELAVLEACERQAVTKWWHKELAVSPISSEWLESEGVLTWLQNLRAKAALKRNTNLWLCTLMPGLVFAVACTTGPNGQDPVLGYGCAWGPLKAVRKAIREALLMELNVVELYALRSISDQSVTNWLQARLSRLTENLVDLLPPADKVNPETTDGVEAFRRQDEQPMSSMVGWFDTDLTLFDVTPPDGPIFVSLCQTKAPVRTFSDDDSPFF